MLPYFGTYEDSGFVHLVSPFMENGTLDNWRIEMNPSALEVETMVSLHKIVDVMNDDRSCRSPKVSNTCITKA